MVLKRTLVDVSAGSVIVGFAEIVSISSDGPLSTSASPYHRAEPNTAYFMEALVDVSSGYQAPSYFYLLKHFDSIYASGLFCHIAKAGRRRDQQLRLVWAVEQMVEKLREVRDENLQSRSPFFHAKRSVKRRISSQFNLKASEGELPLLDRLERETRCYKEARKRLKRGKPLRFVPDYDNLTRAHRQLSASLQFFCAAMHWTGMPKWRKPYLEFEWAPPPPDSLSPTKSVEGGISSPEIETAVESVDTPVLLRGESERPSIADSEATLVGDGEQPKEPPESARSVLSFGFIQSFCSFISDPGNPSIPL